MTQKRPAPTYFTRVYMDAHAQDVDDIFEMVKNRSNPHGPPGCLKLGLEEST